MMLRVNNEYLDFNGTVELDRKAKLFEEIDKLEGDISFEFELELTSRNARIIGFPFPDNDSKRVYQINNTTLLNDDGQILSMGYIKVERKIDQKLLCSFWGGNNNWFAELKGSLRDLVGQSVNMTQANITNSWSNTDGIIFPIVDTGLLSQRGHERLTIEDFHPFVYVKTLVKTIFQKYSIKLQGELLNDWLYNNLLATSGINQEEQAQALRTFAQKNASTPVDDTSIPIPFENISNPFFSTGNYNPVTGEYTAAYKMVVKAKATVNFSDNSDLYQLNIYRNNQPVAGKIAYSPDGQPVVTIDFDILLEAGDTMTVNAEVRNAGGTANAISGTLDITPLYILNMSGYSEFLPDWTEGEFISNLFTIFNVICGYDPISKILTANIFDKIKYKQPVDISEHIESTEIDYTDFISNYGKSNRLLYDADPEEFGSGSIAAANDFLEDEVDIVESEFVANPPIRSVAFKTQLEAMDFRSEFTYISTNITSVSDNSDIARFNVDSTSLMSVGNLVRIETDNELYDGDYVIGTVGVGFFEIDNLSFVATDTGTASRIIQVPKSNQDFYLMIAVPDIAISSFSDISTYFFYNDAITSIAYTYFNLYNENRVINSTHTQSLFFAPDGKENFYQRTLIDQYWTTFSRMVNDPVKATSQVHLPWVIHNKIDFLKPIMVKTLETTNLYYCNLERGYQNSYTPCELALIKLP